MRRLVLAGLVVVVSAVAHAQVEEIVVTSRMREASYEGMPSVIIRKPADFLVQEIRLINDSRSPELRKTEILKTIQGLLKRAADLRNVALSYGEGFLVPIDLNDESLQIIEDQKRPDTSVVDIFVKVTLTEKDVTQERIADLRRFIKEARVVGRTEIEPRGDIGLSIVNPEKYRMELLNKIAVDNSQLGKAMGSQCRVKVAGLERRVEWERTGVAELTLYIPYGVEIGECAYEP
jgi:hypothetical protein